MGRSASGGQRPTPGQLTAVVDYERAVVVVPAHNEAKSLPKCLKALATAAVCAPVAVHIVVVLDACTDESRSLAGRYGADVHFIDVDERNVGASRAAGFEYAAGLCGQRAVDDERVWYATTDADSRVDPDWLTKQLAADADAVLGVVRIANWRNVPVHAMRRYLHAYRTKRRGREHGHVHGANMGFSAAAYRRVGGFARLESGEDVDLVRRLEQDGCRIVRDDRLSVVTSARQVGRAPKGFAGHLRSMRVQRDSA